MNDEQRLEAIRAALSGSGEAVVGQALAIVAAHLEAGDGTTGDVVQDVADRLTRRAYFGMIQTTATEIDDEARKRLRNGDTADDVREWEDERINEEADGSWWTIYTHANFRALFASDNWAAAQEEGLTDGVGDDASKLFAVMTYCAIAADLREYVTDVDELAETIEAEKEASEST
jgi:hypothetical protein